MENSNDYNRLLFDNTVIGLALCKMNGELVDVNSAFAEILGRTIEQTLNLSYWEITPEKYAPQEKVQLESLEATGKYGPYEKEYIHADGHLVPVRLSGQIVKIDGESFIWSNVEDITQLKQAENERDRLYKEIEQLSFLDSLTGIANRRMFDKTIELEWTRAERNKSPLSLIMLDIDFFKQYNDEYGHICGDECLQIVAKTLNDFPKRKTDLIARYGGEEFVILLPNTSKSQLIELTKKYLDAIKEKRIPHKVSTVSDVVTASAGVSSLVPTKEMDSSSLLELADKRLYTAKRKGRDRFEH